MEEIIDIIDENNNVIGQATKSDMGEKLLLHRGACIFVFNSKGEIFVHKRTAHKKLYPDMWDMTIGGCAQTGETHHECAVRELEEESGIKETELKYLFDIRIKSKVDNAILKTYKVIYDGELKLQEDEIVEGFFVTREKLEIMLKEKEFCQSSMEFYRRYKEMEDEQSK